MSRLSDPAEDWVEILKLYGGRCWICGALWEHKDHYVPRALGGADESGQLAFGMSTLQPS